MNVAIVDYSMGNVRSVANAFQMIGCQAVITNNPEELSTATHIVLPGVGAFGEGMQNIQKLGLIPILERESLQNKKPFLGICLGMQLLAEKGFEFGDHKGLGWIPGTVKRLETNELVLPHVGWNNLDFPKPSPLTERLKNGADFYFVHSFHFANRASENCSAVCDYGQKFTAIVEKSNIYGCQFHPEKSQKAGRILLENFVRIK